MTAAGTASLGRRERNKQQKLARIMEAASGLFDEFGVEEVTTQQIADAADIGTGTLFLYARSKAELLLLVQNAHYEAALAQGLSASAGAVSVADAIMALLEPVVACNRRNVVNGRAYLRELIFGDPTEPCHQRGLELIQQLARAHATLLQRAGATELDAALQAEAVSAVMFVQLASPANTDVPDAVVLDAIRVRVEMIINGPRAQATTREDAHAADRRA